MARMNRLTVPFVLSLCIGLPMGMIQAVEAGAEKVQAGSGTKVAAAANPKDTDTTGNTTLTGSVTATLKMEQQQLRRMGESVKRTKRAATDILMECNQPVEMMGEIDIIGQDVIPIMPATSEGFGDQKMPPRPKYINLHMAQLSSLVPILQDEVNTLAVPDIEKSYAAQPLQDLQGNMSDLSKLLTTLQGLTKDKVDYNVQELMSAAKGVESSCKGIDAARKILLHDEAKAEKQEAKLEKDQQKK